MPPRKRQNIEEQPDPFADEAQTQTHDEDTPPWEIEDSETEDNRKVIKVGSDGKFVGTLKGGRDFDEPWIVLHCDTLQELVDNLTNRELLGQAMDAAQQASKRFRDLRPTEDKGTAASAPQNIPQGRAQGRPQAATEHPKGRKEFCQHGEMVFKSGLGKNEKMWGAFDCRVDPKGCPRKWDNDFGK
jgi:hypothetical protein